ncbi:hypothetical protein EJ06DRAFT_9354 [Trichodelitschia bisporula]|uniref:Uncharacterized protein n=1 Tax=Trichodelitschia bisporula TaxID=703511 RepID=A0A6G1IA76_9PEZI|nr:hypothetical protein EJ06DRAFT_9354 [Trichodelitschia bisporula]
MYHQDSRITEGSPESFRITAVQSKRRTCRAHRFHRFPSTPSESCSPSKAKSRCAPIYPILIGATVLLWSLHGLGRSAGEPSPNISPSSTRRIGA